MSKITKLGLGIVCFEGSEFVKSITAELRNEVDYILVCLQKVSYHGEPIEQFDIDEIEMCKKAGLIDEIIWFNPDLSYLKQEKFDPKTPRLIETEKRNMMIQHLEDVGCSHDIIIDSDEFYDHDEFVRAKQFFNDNTIEVSYCQYINFYRDTMHYMVWTVKAFVPFIADIRFRFLYTDNFMLPSDPTRRYNIPVDDKCKEFYVYPWNELHMNHLSWIRLDITKKLDAWSAKRYFDNIPNFRERILDRYYNYKDGLNAIIMFMVPNYEVCVNKLDKPYFRLKYRLDEKI